MSTRSQPHYCPTCNSLTIHSLDRRRSEIAHQPPEWARMLGMLFFWHPITWVIVFFGLHDWPFRDTIESPLYRCPKCNLLLDGSYLGERPNQQTVVHTMPDALRGGSRKWRDTAGAKPGYRQLGVAKVEGVTRRDEATGESRLVMLLAIDQALQRSGPVPVELKAVYNPRDRATEIAVIWNGRTVGTLPFGWSWALSEGKLSVNNLAAQAHAVVGIEPFRPHLGLRLTMYEREGAVPQFAQPTPATRAWRPDRDEDLSEPPYDPDEEYG